jgi:hypothetical protein
MPRTFEEEELLRLLAASQPIDTPLRAPADYEYNQRASKFLGEADELDRRAETPMAKPQGFKEHAVSGIRAFVEGMARPQDPYAMQRQREAQHSAEMSQLAERAQKLRTASAGQQQMGETARLRQVQEDREKRETAQQEFENKKANRPQFAQTTQGYGSVNPETGVYTPQWEKPDASTSASGDKEVHTYTRRDGKVVTTFIRPDKTTYDVTSENPAREGSGLEPGAYTVGVNPQGNITGAWNPKSGVYKEPPKEITEGGMRKSPMAVSELQQESAMDVMLQDIGTLRQLAERNKGSIGTIEGRATALQRATTGTSDEVNEMFRLSDNMSDMLLRARSGAQINEQEYNRLRSLVPNPRGPEGKFFSDLAGFESELKRTLAARRGQQAPQAAPAAEAPSAAPAQPAVDLSQWKVRVKGK